MKHVETNFLIYDLAKQGNTQAKTSVFKFIFSVISLSALSVLLYLLNVELRADIDYVGENSWFNLFNLQFYVFFINIFLGSYLSYKLSIPGQSDKLSYKLFSFIFYALWTALLSTMSIYAYQEYIYGAELVLHFDCIDKALLALIMPMVIVFYFIKKGYVLNKFKTMVTASLTAFSFASFVNLFVCPATDAIHIFFSHNLVILPIIIIFMIILKVKNN